MSNKVFISYAHKDNEIAKELVEKLSSKGIETWFDINELKPGESWELQTRNALIESSAVVLVFGEGELSPNVLVEAGMALEQGKQIVPVVVGENAKVKVFPNLQQVHAVGLEDIETAADQIVNAVSDRDQLLTSNV